MIVFDCSAAVNIARDTFEGKALLALIANDNTRISSELLRIESASAIRKYVLSGFLDTNNALAILQDAVSLVDDFIPIQENYMEAFHESLRLRHSIYDMLYFTLAQRYSATLVTLDIRLINLCEEQRVDCIHLIDLSNASE